MSAATINPGRMALSGRIGDVCDKLDQMVAEEAQGAPFTEAELIAADVQANQQKSERFHRTNDRRALVLQNGGKV